MREHYYVMSPPDILTDFVSPSLPLPGNAVEETISVSAHAGQMHCILTPWLVNTDCCWNGSAVLHLINRGLYYSTIALPLAIA